MRVISGKYKGRILMDNPYGHIRPTTDKVKQAVFTKLQFEVEGARVLDLFCGTGALGIEAISRGAREVIFVDQNEKSISLTKNNLKHLGGEGKVIKGDAVTVLDKFNEGFDLIFIDPPYKSGLYESILNKISERRLLNEDGTIICEHSKGDEYDYSSFEKYDEKNYGTITVSYLTNKEG